MIWIQDFGTKTWYLLEDVRSCPYTCGVLKETKRTLFKRVGYGWVRVPKRIAKKDDDARNR